MKKFILLLTMIVGSLNINAQIQEMIDAANAGDVVTVTSDTYTLGATILIDKDISLECDAVGGCIIDATAVEGAFSITACGADISGFNIQGGANTTWGISVSTPGLSCAGTEISFNEISGMSLPNQGNSSPLSYGILVYGSSATALTTGVTITLNNIHDIAGSGISLGDFSSSINIWDNTISDITNVVYQGQNFAAAIQASAGSIIEMSGNFYSNVLIAHNLVLTNASIYEDNGYSDVAILLADYYLGNSLVSLYGANDDPTETLYYTLGSLEVGGVPLTVKAWYNDYATAEIAAETGTTSLYNADGTFALLAGCTDEDACNYNADAFIDDGSCTYPVDACTDCNGADLGGQDCLGECNGSAVLDECGTCDADASNDCTQDCAGEWGGALVFDECGVCDGPGPDAGYDCAGNLLEDFVELTLTWSGAGTSASFVVTGVNLGEIYSYSSDQDSGTMTQAWPTSFDDDCYVIEIEGPETLTWTLSTPEIDGTSIEVLNGTNMNMNFGENCVADCMDMAACNYNVDANISDETSCSYAEANANCDGDCLEGFTQLTLEWSGADSATSFTVTNLAGEQLHSQTLSEGSGSDVQCWAVDGVPSDCFAINIEGPDGLTWELFTPLSSTDPLISGTNADTTFGEECVFGCTDASACNYDSSANTENDSCTYPINAYTDCDGNCLAGSIPLTLSWTGGLDASFSVVTDGITLVSEELMSDAGTMSQCFSLDLENNCFVVSIDATEGIAWNLSSELSTEPILSGGADDLLVGNEEGYNCDGTCLMDEDGDGVCDEFEIPGCTAVGACNYNELATDDDGTCIFTYEGASCDGTCADGLVALTLSWTGANSGDNFSISSDNLGNDYFVALFPNANGSGVGCFDSSLQDDCFEINMESNSDNLEWSLSSPLSTDPILIGGAEDFLFGPTCPAGCTDELACNFDINAVNDDGSCAVPDEECQECCTYSDGTWVLENYPGSESSISASGDNWSLSTVAWTNETENTPGNYTALFEDAQLESNCYTGLVDVSVTYSTELNSEGDPSIVGDIMFTLSNDEGMIFETTTTISGIDNTGILGDISGGVTEYVVDVDTDGDGVIDCEEIAGCTDVTACNYNELATDDDGLCTYIDGTCDTCEEGVVVDNDADDDGVCDGDEVAGCTDLTACNYDELATDDDGSCVFVDGICDTCEEGVVIDNDADGDGVCDGDEVVGCTDPTACNYNELATDDNGCIFDFTDPVPAIWQLYSTTLEVQGDHGYASYQWYHNDETIDGAMLNMLMVTLPGEYHVEVVNQDGCQASSNTITFGSPTTADNRLIENGVNLHPNPSNGLVHLTMKEDLGRDYVVEVYDNLGRLMLIVDNRFLQLEDVTIDLSNFNPSLYNVIVKYSDGQIYNSILIKK